MIDQVLSPGMVAVAIQQGVVEIENSQCHESQPFSGAG
jgi:hypothetical protein